MKKADGFTRRMFAILLSGMLAVGTIPGTALAAEVQENTVQEEEAITTYTVTLDANGGYFVNEWDDVIGDYIESTEILNKQIPVGETVTTVPVFETGDQQTQAMTFLGWSLERDGEPVSQRDEEYAPVDDCVLYAVWELNESGNTGETTDTSREDIDQNDMGIVNEDTDLIDDTQELNEEKEEDIKDRHIEENTNPDANSVRDIEENVTTTNQKESKRNFEPERLEETKSEIINYSSMDEKETGLLPQAIWTEDNKTLTFYYGTDIVPGEVFNGFPVSNVWSGDDVVNSPKERTFYNAVSYSDKQKPVWLSTINKTVENVIFDESFLRVSPTSTMEWFSGCGKLTKIDFSGLNTSSVEIMGGMFSGCKSLTSLDLSGFDTSNVTRMDEVFKNCTGLTSINISSFDTSNVINMLGMFYHCNNLTYLDLSGFDTSSVTNMEDMFSWCEGLTSLDLSSFDTSNVNSFTDMFYRCINLPYLDVAGFNTSNAIYMDKMFMDCNSLATIDVSGFDTTNVTDMDYMFSDCNSLATVDVSGFDTTNVTDMGYMFRNCNKLTTIDVSGFDTTNVIDMSYMFSNCNSLTTIDVSGFDMSNVKETKYMFNGCTNVSMLDFSGSYCDIDPYGSCWDYMFRNCTELKQLNFGTFSFHKIEGTYGVFRNSSAEGMFYNCSNLTSIYFAKDSVSWPRSITGSNAFYGCTSLVGKDSEATVLFDSNKTDISMAKTANLGGYFSVQSALFGGISIQSLMPDNGEEYVIPSLFNQGSPYGKVYIEFNNLVDITGTGSVHLHNYKTDEIVKTIPLIEDNRYDGFSCIDKKLCLTFNINLNKGEKYYITIDENALRFQDPSTLEDLDIAFSGLKKGDWCFKIIDFEVPSFENPSVNIGYNLYHMLFAPIYADFIRVIDDGSKGLCYGMGYTAQAWKQQWRGVVAATRSYSIEEIPIEADYNTGLSYLEYIEWVHLSQYMPSEIAECSMTTDKYQKIYDTVCAAINGTGKPVMLGLQGGPDGGHAVLPVAILSDTEEKAEIIIYDSSAPIDSRTGTKTFYPTLTFTKTDNVVTGFKYRSYTKLNYNTFDNSADEGAYLFHAFEDTVNNGGYKMVISSQKLTDNIHSALYPITPRNGSSPDDDIYLYWTEGSSLTTSEGREVSITNGYKEIGAKTDGDAEITLNFDEQSVNITSSGENSSNYFITYKTADNYTESESIKISGVSKGNINAQMTEEGILLTTENEKGVEGITASVDVNSSTVNSVDCITSTDSILITVGDNQSVYIKEDTDSDGTYETVISGGSAKDIKDAEINGISNKTYTGAAIKQSIVVTHEGKKLVEGTDYTLSYANNIDAGTATVTITGEDKYTGTVDKTFTIEKANQNFTVKASSSVDVGKTTRVTVSGAKGSPKFTYNSSNKSVATVSSNGTVNGKAAGTVTITVKSTATANYKVGTKTVKITVNKTLKKPGKCHFAKWNNKKFTSCQIAWNKVAGAEGYQTLLSWTDGSHASSTYTKSNVLYRNCTVHPKHVSQMKVRAYYMQNGQRKFGPWSNVEYITPSPTKLTTKNASAGSNLKMKISWNIIYGCNGYNVFVTTNPNGKWNWNQSTSIKANATSAVIDKCNGKLKKKTRYYVRIVTRRKRKGVFCTVPMPANNFYTGTFIIK